MTFSPLISGTIPHSNKYNKRLEEPSRVIQHHWAGTSGGDKSLADPNAKKSATYVIYDDGRIFGQVPEEFRPWTSGGPTADNPSITIEVQNSTGAPEWAISEKAQRAIEQLVAEIATRRGWGDLNATNYRGHREFAATACPGPYLWARLPEIRHNANAIKNGGTVAPKPPTEQVSTDQRVILATDGIRGPETVGQWQLVMDTPFDKVISKPKSSLIIADQEYLNRVVGPEHQRNLHGRSSLVEDGSEGPKTVVVRQFMLRNFVALGHQINLIGKPLEFDSINGPLTNIVHQFALNHAATGSREYGRV